MLTTGRHRIAAVLAGVLLAALPPLSEAAAEEPTRPPVLSLITSAATVTHGDQVAVTARLTGADGAPLVGVTVDLLRSRALVTRSRPFWRGRTSKDGTVTGLLTPLRNVDVVARVGASAGQAATVSRVVRVLVRPVLSARSPRSVAAGAALVLRGDLVPARPGRTVLLERRDAGTWRQLARTTLSPTGAYAFRVTAGGPGALAYRVSVAASPDLAGATTLLPSISVLPVWTYSVTSRGAVTVNVEDFARSVADTYADPRGWSRSGRGLRRVASGGDFTVVLSEARLLPSFSPVCSARYSCRVGRLVIINQDRWRFGSAPFPGPLAQYRQMVVNHETGHWLGVDHQSCGGAGRLAPVMQQQSKAMLGCLPNAWPSAYEVGRARR